MSFAPSQGSSPLDDFIARSLRGAHGVSKVITRKPSHTKRGPAAAWAAWAAGSGPADGSEFFASVASWTEGTAAQLLRPQWPVGAARPTPQAVQDRLCHHLEVVLRRGGSTYLEALELAREAAIEELRAARTS